MTRNGLHGRGMKDDAVQVNLHDWIDELMDVLDIDGEIDEGLILDVAREAAHRVVRPAAPISTYLLGYAAGLAGGGLEETEALAARVLGLAEKWEGGEDLEAALQVDEAELDGELPDGELVEAE